MRETKVLCDECGKAGKTWTLIPPDAGDEAVEVDLCPTHGKPLAALARKGTPVPLPRARRKTFELTALKDTPKPQV